MSGRRTSSPMNFKVRILLPLPFSNLLLPDDCDFSSPIYIQNQILIEVANSSKGFPSFSSRFSRILLIWNSDSVVLSVLEARLKRNGPP